MSHGSGGTSFFLEAAAQFVCLSYVIKPSSARLRKIKELFLLVVCAADENRRVRRNNQTRTTFGPKNVADLKFKGGGYMRAAFI